VANRTRTRHETDSTIRVVPLGTHHPVLRQPREDLTAIGRCRDLCFLRTKVFEQEAGRQAVPATTGRPGQRASSGPEPDPGGAGRGVRAPPHVHRFSRARRAERGATELEEDRAGAADDTCGVAGRGIGGRRRLAAPAPRPTPQAMRIPTNQRRGVTQLAHAPGTRKTPRKSAWAVRCQPRRRAWSSTTRRTSGQPGSG
jgi:hypothetical protein